MTKGKVDQDIDNKYVNRSRGLRRPQIQFWSISHGKEYYLHLDDLGLYIDLFRPPFPRKKIRFSNF